MRVALIGLLWTLACAPGQDDEDDTAGDGGGKVDDTDPSTFACKSVDGISLDALVEIDDPIATFLIKRGDDCPADYAAMIGKLRTVDPEGCEAGNDMITRIVSDDARLDPAANNFRTVTTRACGSRPNHSLFWTLLGVNAGENVGKRTFVEMAALDRNTGRYNFWVFGGGRFSFEGDSVQAAAGQIACGGCHRGGDVLMKELDDPWIHWESTGNPLPGVDQLFAAHAPMFGQRGDGKELEQLVRAGNDVVVEARIGHHQNPASGSVSALLKPLFCTEVVNLDTAGRQVDGPVTDIPADALIDPHFGVARSIAIDPAAYEAGIAAAGQTVQGVSNRTDTEFKLVFPERGGMDDAYVQALIAEGILDEDFVLDVLSIDFTRPVFSDARCGLLSFAPSYGGPGSKTIAEATPATLRAAFIGALEASQPVAGTPAAELLAHLGETDDAQGHRERVDAYLAACETRSARDLVDDVLRHTHLVRQQLRTATSLIEHPEQMPTITATVAATAHLDAATCTLVE